MPYYLTNIDVLGFEAIIRKIAMTTATAPTLAAGVTKVGLRNSTAVSASVRRLWHNCKHKINPGL